MPSSGQIVEYLDQNRFYCGAVIEDHGRRIRLVNQNGRDVKLPVARILHQDSGPRLASLSRDEQVAALGELHRRRQELAAAVPLADIWELAAQDGETDFSPAFLASLAFGEEADDDHVAAFLRAVIGDKVFFRYRNGRVEIHSPEVVAQQQEKKRRQEAERAILVNGSEVLRKISRGDDPGCDPAFAAECLDLVENYYLYGSEFEQYKLARELLKQAGQTAPHAPYHLLVASGRWQPHENFYLARYRVPTVFSSEALEEAAAVSSPDLAELLAEGYRDLTAMPCLTIDGEDTTDHDDALHIEKTEQGWRVGVHIAEVCRFAPPGSHLFETARERGTSIYFPDGQVSMLPERISADVASLREGEVRPVVSFLFDFAENGAIRGREVCRSAIVVKRRLSYREVGGMLAEDSDLAALARLARGLRRERIEAGAVLMPVPDVVITPGDEVRVELVDADSTPRLLVAEFMVLANRLAASYLADRGVPGLFRAQEEPFRRFVEGGDSGLFLNLKQRKFLKPARILTAPAHHSGIGAEAYTTATSPIRRFFDLVMQTQLVSVLATRMGKFSERELKEFIGDITTCQSRAGLVWRLRHRYWLLRYLEARKNEPVEVLVLENSMKKIVAVLTDCLLESVLPPNQAVRSQPGETMMVRIGRVSPLDDLLRLEV